MSNSTSIARAYCQQLNEVLSIAEARRAFFSLSPPRNRFDFLCSNEACRKLSPQAKITAVNYDKQPSDTYQAAHFRLNTKYQHAPDCEWIDPKESDTGEMLPGETEENASQRRARRKLHDYIDVFDPNPTPTEGTSETPTALEPVLHDGSRGPTPDAIAGTRSSTHRTSSLERLVECYRMAKQELSSEEFRSMKLRVVGEGEIPLQWYFKAVEYAKLGISNRVLHGGATLAGRYGMGFKLKFYDKIDGKPIFLYVSKDQMGEYRFRRYLDELLQSEDADYFRVFALGQLALSPSGKSIDLQISDLNQLVLIPGQKTSKQS